MDSFEISNKFVLKNIANTNNISEMNNSPKSSLKTPSIEITDADTSKENFNPRPLSEIADKTLKQNQFTGTSTSTPNHKNQKFNDDLDSTLDTSSLILPHQPQPLSENNIPKQEFNISLLTAGFNNLGLVPGDRDINNITSDEDESFAEAVQSFTDLQDDVDMHSNTTIVKEEIFDEIPCAIEISSNKRDSLDLQNRTFDQVELESKASDDSAVYEEQVTRQLSETQIINEEEQIKTENKLEETHVISNDQELNMTKDIKFEETRVISDEQFDPEILVLKKEIEIEDNGMANEINMNIQQDEEVTKTDEIDYNQTYDKNEITNFVEREEIVNPFTPTSTLDFKNLDDIKRETESITFKDEIENDLKIQFKVPTPTNIKLMKDNKQEEFRDSASVNFSASDFDYIEHFGAVRRSSTNGLDSVLLTFDPLLSRPKPKPLPVTQEEPEFHDTSLVKQETTFGNISQNSHSNEFQDCSTINENEMNYNMRDLSTIDAKIESNHYEESKQDKLKEEYIVKMAEMESKIKQEAEMREEALLKRISEKDKQITKMNGVVEAYEKAISELIAEKEQLILSYDKKCNDLKNDSELNANHLSSLEATFSDLHAKYERTKHLTQDLYEREKTIVLDRKTLNESLKMQEARYDKMKSHAMAQLEIANNTLAEMNRNHQAESTKLKALLKKEEIARASINEQLLQKSKENSELVKICDELINGSQPM